MNKYEQLADYRRRVSQMYARVRDSQLDGRSTWEEFRTARDELFATHQQSPLSLDQKRTFTGLSYHPYDERLCFHLPVTEADGAISEVGLQEGPVRMARCGKIAITMDRTGQTLSLFWILGYGGGLFLPFHDTSPETYGGGRYVLDTIKHADLGRSSDGLIIDFNYAYNPSCAYNPRWECPLAPVENRLPIAIMAGEKNFAP